MLTRWDRSPERALARAESQSTRGGQHLEPGSRTNLGRGREQARCSDHVGDEVVAVVRYAEVERWVV